MRTPMITKEDLPEDKRHVWDQIAGSRGGVRGPFQVLLNSPEVASRATHLGTYLRYEGVLDGAIRELAIVSTAREFDAQVEWAAHTPLALKEGATQAAIDAVRDRKSLEGLSDQEATVIQYCRELFGKKRVAQATFDKALELFGVQGLTELTVTMGYYSMIACCLNAFEVEPSPEAELRLPV